MSGLVTLANLKNIRSKTDELAQSISSEYRICKDLDGKKNHKKIKQFLEHTRLTSNISRVLSNHKDSEKFVELSNTVFRFLKENNDVSYVDSAVYLDNEEKTLTSAEEQQLRYVMLKKGYDFCQSLLRYATVNIRNAKTEKEEKKGKKDKTNDRSISIDSQETGNKINSKLSNKKKQSAPKKKKEYDDELPNEQEQKDAIAKKKLQEKVIVNDDSDDSCENEIEIPKKPVKKPTAKSTTQKTKPNTKIQKRQEQSDEDDEVTHEKDEINIVNEDHDYKNNSSEEQEFDEQSDN